MSHEIEKFKEELKQRQSIEGQVTRSGRQIASEWMATTVKCATDDQDMTSKMLQLQAAAFYLIATVMYNRKRQGGADINDLLDQALIAINRELDFIESGPGDVVHASPGQEFRA